MRRSLLSWAGTAALLSTTACALGSFGDEAETAPIATFGPDGDGGTGSPLTTGASADDDDALGTTGPVPSDETGHEPPSDGETDGLGESDGGSSSTTADPTGADPSDTGDTSPEPPEPPEPAAACCASEPQPGCRDAAIEACVCAADSFCCATAWDIACVVEVEDLGCGGCGTLDEVASCDAMCGTFVACDSSLGYDTVQECVDLECLGLLDQAQADGAVCLEAMSTYAACLGLLDCGAYADYLEHAPGFPCEGFEDDFFAACAFISG